MDLTSDDWRMQALTHLTKDWANPWTNVISPKGTKITAISSTKLNKKTQLTIALPNATALCVNSSRRAWKGASKIRKSSEIDKSLKKEVTFNSNAEAFDYIEMVMESVVMAYTALEAFVNENIPDDYKYHTHRKSEIIIEVMDKDQIERWLALDEKLSSVLPEILGVETPKKHGCWSDFKKLQKIRNRIIHMKKEDRKSSGPEEPTLWHDIFKLEPPYRQAKKLIDYYIKAIENKPRWYGEYPKER